MKILLRILFISCITVDIKKTLTTHIVKAEILIPNKIFENHWSDTINSGYCSLFNKLSRLSGIILILGLEHILTAQNESSFKCEAIYL
jgi:hypothetical protein